jgi:hypothetical protein
VLTPAEERFEKARQTIGLFLGPIVFLIVYFLPLPLERDQHTLAAILSFTIVYWLSEAIPIPVTAVLALALCVLFNIPQVGPNADDAPGDIVFGGFIDPVIFLFIGVFIIAQAMVTHGLDRRFAFRILSLPGVSNTTYGVIIALASSPPWRHRRPDKFGHLQHNYLRDAPANRARDYGGTRGTGKGTVWHREGRDPAPIRHRSYAHDRLRRGGGRTAHTHRNPAEPHRYRLYRGRNRHDDNLLQLGPGRAADLPAHVRSWPSALF